MTERAATAHVCARCPKVLGQSCCEVKPGEHLATLTRDDVRRISAHLRRPATAFVAEEVMDDDAARDYEARRPLYRGYFRQGPVRLSLRVVQGACVFLDRECGCSLPSDVRPTACRLYPFELFPSGEWSVAVGRTGDLARARETSDGCLAVEEADGMGDILRAFDLDRPEVERLGAQLRAEVKRHGHG